MRSPLLMNFNCTKSPGAVGIAETVVKRDIMRFAFPSILIVHGARPSMSSFTSMTAPGGSLSTLTSNGRGRSNSLRVAKAASLLANILRSAGVGCVASHEQSSAAITAIANKADTVNVGARRSTSAGWQK